ncbi:DNA mismatch endonuclease Vsr [Candidatus Poribacteria bacterium]|nr:DNA mismatch endonuclease Vsr [Candidatus Poribacteria bacterium]
MRKVRSRDTIPEVAFRRALASNGLRYRVCPSKLAGKPDIVLPSRRLAIFIDGDFWHGGQWSRRKLASLEEQFQKTKSRDYWLAKIRKNMERDCRATAALLREGWQVLRFWESDIRKDMEGCVRMALEVANNGAKPGPYSVLPQRTFAEFFAGIGLMRLALENQGWSITYANDIDPQKYEMYKTHFEDADRHHHLGDIHDVPSRRIPTVTLATASFPCNDLSLAGARKGLGGKQSSAFWGFIRILEEMRKRRPPLVLLENVTGFLTSANGHDFKDALLALNNLGYDVDAFILDAGSFVPQSRQRLFVVGILNRLESSYDVCETPRFYESRVRLKMLADFIFHHPEIRWRLRDLPAPPQTTKTLEDVLEDLPENAPEWWNTRRAEYLLNQMSPRHSAVAEDMINGARWSYGTVFRRIRKGKSMAELRTDGIAGCLRTPRGGSARQILFKAGKGKFFVRFLTPRECARLMGADDFRISAPLNQALFGFGDAVCVPVIEWIAKHYLNPTVIELIRGHPLAAHAK